MHFEFHAELKDFINVPIEQLSTKKVVETIKYCLCAADAWKTPLCVLVDCTLNQTTFHRWKVM